MFTDKIVIPLDASPPVAVSEEDMLGTQQTHHLLNEALSGTRGVVANYVELPGGFAHRWHRHPHADQVLVPLSGPPLHFAVGDEVAAVRVGEIGIARRTQWHFTANRSDEPIRALVMFLGVSAMEEAGYESAPADHGPAV